MEITCENVVSSLYYDTVNHKWTDMPQDIRKDAWEHFVKFVAGSSRGNKRKRILSNLGYIGGVHNAGILSRLIFDTNTKSVAYCAGQDYTSEMGILRDIFD